jgi:hypothetical protein
LGRRLRRKLPALVVSLGGAVRCGLRGGMFCGCFRQGRPETGGGSAGHSGSGTGAGLGGCGGCLVSGIRLLRKDPSGCGM